MIDQIWLRIRLDQERRRWSTKRVFDGNLIKIIRARSNQVAKTGTEISGDVTGWWEVKGSYCNWTGGVRWGAVSHVTNALSGLRKHNQLDLGYSKWGLFINFRQYFDFITVRTEKVPTPDHITHHKTPNGSTYAFPENYTEMTSSFEGHFACRVTFRPWRCESWMKVSVAYNNYWTQKSWGESRSPWGHPGSSDDSLVENIHNEPQWTEEAFTHGGELSLRHTQRVLEQLQQGPIHLFTLRNGGQIALVV